MISTATNVSNVERYNEIYKAKIDKMDSEGKESWIFISYKNVRYEVEM